MIHIDELKDMLAGFCPLEDCRECAGEINNNGCSDCIAVELRKIVNVDYLSEDEAAAFITELQDAGLADKHATLFENDELLAKFAEYKAKEKNG